MVLCQICEIDKYASLAYGISKTVEFLNNHDLKSLKSLPDGRTQIDGDNIYINKGEEQLIDELQRKLEIHHEYMDIHIPLTGEEFIGWKSVSTLQTKPVKPFDEDKDIAFYDEPFDSLVMLEPGQCVLVFPEDAHAPLIGEGKIIKAVIKIRL